MMIEVLFFVFFAAAAYAAFHALIHKARTRAETPYTYIAVCYATSACTHISLRDALYAWGIL